MQYNIIKGDLLQVDRYAANISNIKIWNLFQNSFYNKTLTKTRWIFFCTFYTKYCVLYFEFWEKYLYIFYSFFFNRFWFDIWWLLFDQCFWSPNEYNEKSLENRFSGQLPAADGYQPPIKYRAKGILMFNMT